MPQEARQIHRVSKYRKHAKALSIRISQNIGEWDERDAAVGGEKDGFIYHRVEGIPITKSRKMMKDEQRELLAMYISISIEIYLYLYTYIYISIMEKKGWAEARVLERMLSIGKFRSAKMFRTFLFSWKQAQLAAAGRFESLLSVCVCLWVCLRPTFQYLDGNDSCDSFLMWAFLP